MRRFFSHFLSFRVQVPGEFILYQSSNLKPLGYLGKVKVTTWEEPQVSNTNGSGYHICYQIAHCERDLKERLLVSFTSLCIIKVSETRARSVFQAL